MSSGASGLPIDVRTSPGCMASTVKSSLPCRALKLRISEFSAALLARYNSVPSPSLVLIEPLSEDMKRVENAGDNAKLERFKTWLKNLRNDPYLDEATNVLNDMVTQTNLVYANVNKNQ
jgi:hypothetical protein